MLLGARECIQQTLIPSIFVSRNYSLLFTSAALIKNSEYDQEIPQSQTADKPMASRGRATQQSRETMKTN